MKLVYSAVAVVLLAMSSAANAGILSCDANDDGSGAFVLTSKYWHANLTSNTLDASGNQYRTGGGELVGVTTNTPGDPNLWIYNDLENDTSFAWTGFQFNVTEAQPYSILYGVGPTNWTAAITQPTLQGGVYVGTVDFAQATGAAIAVGGDGLFGVEISFAGFTGYSYQIGLNPTPEPATLALLCAGALGLLRRRRKA